MKMGGGIMASPMYSLLSLLFSSSFFRPYFEINGLETIRQKRVANFCRLYEGGLG